MTIHVCCKCMFSNVSTIWNVYCQCFIWMLLGCIGYTRILQMYVWNVLAVLNVYYKCFIWILHMLHWLYMYVSSVCFKCCSYFKRILQVFYLDVALQVYVSNVLTISNVYCKCFIWMLHILQCPYTYVANVCCKCFICFGHMLQQMFYVASVSWAGKYGPLGHKGPCVCMPSEAGTTSSAGHKAISMGVAVGAEHKVASMGGQQVRSTRRSWAWTCIHGACSKRGAWNCIHRRPMSLPHEDLKGGMQEQDIHYPINSSVLRSTFSAQMYYMAVCMTFLSYWFLVYVIRIMLVLCPLS
jgi:hypothetical protein